MKRSFIREILEHTSSDTISFAGGLPDVSLFPHKALQSAAENILEDPESLQYSTSTGYAPLKAQIAKRYTEQGLVTNSDNILITSGSQQALDIICRYHSGASIVRENPSYLGAFNIFKLNHMQEYSVALRADGIELEAFSKSVNKATLAYLIPDFQNPSATCYSTKHRAKVAKILASSNTLLIEDAPYSELYFERPYESISHLLPKQSYHLGSFSKVLSPALRIGWIRADKALLDPLVAYKEAMDLHTSSITQRIVSAYLNDENHFTAHLQKLRTGYEEKMLYFARQLAEILPNFEFTMPKGGMFIYGRLKGIDTMALLRRCLDEGVIFVPGCEFDGKRDEIRFNFSHSNLIQIKKGLEKIKRVLETSYPLNWHALHRSDKTPCNGIGKVLHIASLRKVITAFFIANKFRF